MLRILTLFCLLSITAVTVAQPSRGYGFLPRVVLSGNLSTSFRNITSAESRILFYDDGEFDLQHSLTDLSTLFSYRWFSNMTVSAGYMIRLRQGGPSHRLLQQFTLIQAVRQTRLSYRLAFDQTLSSQATTVYRARFRIQFELPLSGEKIDIGEFYLKPGIEAIGITQGGTQGAELRITPLIGYEISPSNRIEAGVDYRIRKMEHASQSNSQLFVHFSWFSSLPSLMGKK